MKEENTYIVFLSMYMQSKNWREGLNGVRVGEDNSLSGGGSVVLMIGRCKRHELHGRTHLVTFPFTN